MLFKSGRDDRFQSQLRLGALITHRFPLPEYANAYATLRHATGPRGKVLIEVNAA
jgi:hypothetical protein